MLLVDYLGDFSQLNLVYTIMHANVMNIRFSGEIKVALKVSRSRDMKQKIYEMLTSPKIQMNGVILNNPID